MTYGTRKGEDDEEEVPMVAWELVGVFDSEEKAVAACLDNHCFVGPITLNEITPKERISWPGCYYPLVPESAGNRIN